MAFSFPAHILPVFLCEGWGRGVTQSHTAGSWAGTSAFRRLAWPPSLHSCSSESSPHSRGGQGLPQCLWCFPVGFMLCGLRRGHICFTKSESPECEGVRRESVWQQERGSGLTQTGVSSRSVPSWLCDLRQVTQPVCSQFPHLENRLIIHHGVLLRIK